MKITRTEHFDIQRKIVANMTTESWEQIPHVAYVYEADVTDLMTEFKKLRSTGKTKITLNTVLMKAIIEGLKAAPVMNSHLSYNRKLVRGELKTFEDINISMPMLLPDGRMMTVNLRDFQNKSLLAMTDYIADVTRRAENTNLNEVMFDVSLDNTITGLKQGKVKQTVRRLIGSKTGKHKVHTLRGVAKKAYYSIPEKDRLTKKDIEQGTVTISNLGSLYRGQSGYGTLIEIVPPQVCAFALGAVQDKPVVVTDKFGNKTIEARQILPITVVFDHRALDFGDVIPFLKKMDSIFAHPQVIQAWKGQERVKAVVATEGEGVA